MGSFVGTQMPSEKETESDRDRETQRDRDGERQDEVPRRPHPIPTGKYNIVPKRGHPRTLESLLVQTDEQTAPPWRDGTGEDPCGGGDMGCPPRSPAPGKLRQEGRSAPYKTPSLHGGPEGRGRVPPALSKPTRFLWARRVRHSTRSLTPQDGTRLSGTRMATRAAVRGRAVRCPVPGTALSCSALFSLK